VPSAKVVYYLENDGTVPIVEWLASVPRKASAKCQAYLARLQSEGHELRRPIADYLRDGIHELRPSLEGVHYRILYFFHGNEAVVVSHGLIKERTIPAAEIERAVKRMEQFRLAPRKHTFIPVEGE
jgi:phage-related protein